MKSWRRKVCRQLVVARRELKRLVAIAERRATEPQSPRAAPGFRPLCEAEAEAIVGANLLVQVAAAAVALRS
jgi:hypothetical protein